MVLPSEISFYKEVGYLQSSELFVNVLIFCFCFMKICNTLYKCVSYSCMGVVVTSYKTLAFSLGLLSVCDLNAFRIEEFNHPQWFGVRYRSYCFSKEESDRIRSFVSQGKSIASALGVIPGVGDAAKVISAALDVASFTTWWASGKGKKGFSVNIAINGVGAPYLWESEQCLGLDLR